MNVYYTTNDGYYIAVKDGVPKAYEGLALCPEDVKEWLKDNKPVELPYFYWEAVSYGYCH